jgi:MFS family permease
MKKSPLASVLSIVFIDLVGFGMIIPILPLYAQRFQVGVFGRLAKRFGDATLLSAGLATMAISMLLMPLAGDFLLFLFFSGVFAVGNGFSAPVANTIASKGASAALQGRVLGVVDSAGCLGRVFGPMLGGFLLSGDHARPIVQYGNSPFL